MSEVVDELAAEQLFEDTAAAVEGLADTEPTPPYSGVREEPINDLAYDYDDTDDEHDDDSDTDSLDEDLAYVNAQLQWEESVRQLKNLVGIVILPLIGKVLGRRFAGVVWRRVMDALC